MSVSDLGNGLTIVIDCDYLPHHDWMAFLTWWSISKNLPDAKIVVCCKRQDMSLDIFNWPIRCGVPFIYHKKSHDDLNYFLLTHPKIKCTEPFLTVSPELVFIRDFEEADFDKTNFQKNCHYSDLVDFSVDCREENNTVCINYSTGWGNFNTQEWINKLKTPLLEGYSFKKSGMSCNEIRLAKLWESASRIYQSVSRR